MFDIHNFGFSAEGSFEVEGELCTSAPAFAFVIISDWKCVSVCVREGLGGGGGGCTFIAGWQL